MMVAHGVVSWGFSVWGGRAVRRERACYIPTAYAETDNTAKTNKKGTGEFDF